MALLQANEKTLENHKSKMNSPENNSKGGNRGILKPSSVEWRNSLLSIMMCSETMSCRAIITLVENLSDSCIVMLKGILS